MDLPEFLNARLAEDEEVARAATCRLPGASEWVAGAANADGVRTEAGTLVTKFSWPHEMAHIARWDPAHVLAWCAAVRAVVGLHRHEPKGPGPVFYDESRDSNEGVFGCTICSRMDDDPGWHLTGGWCDTLLALAQPFAGHDDFKAEWRPAD